MTRESDLRRQREAKFAAKPKPGPEYLGRPTTDCRTSFPVDDIRIGERHRKDMGDLAGLAANMDEITLLQPIGVRPDGMLIWGERRLRAAGQRRSPPAGILKVFSPPSMGDGTNGEAAMRRAPLSIDAGRLRHCDELLDRCPRQPHIHQSLRGAARKIGVLRDALEVGMDSVAQDGEGDRRFAFKQRASQLLLEPDNGVGQRGLGDAALSGCPRETALLAKRQKIPNLVHFHAYPLRTLCSRRRLAIECRPWSVR